MFSFFFDVFLDAVFSLVKFAITPYCLQSFWKKNSHPGLLLVCLELSLTSFLARWEQRYWEKHTLNAGRVSFLLPLGSLCPVSWEFNHSVAMLFFGRCDRRKIPLVTDLEYDSFISEHVPRTQLLVVSVTSSLWVENVTSVFSNNKYNAPPIACLRDYTPTTYVFSALWTLALIVDKSQS